MLTWYIEVFAKCLYKGEVCQVPVLTPVICYSYSRAWRRSWSCPCKILHQGWIFGMFWHLSSNVFFNTNLSHGTVSVKHSLHVYVSVLSTTSPLSLCLSLSLNVALWVGWKYGRLFLVLKKRSDILYAVIRREGFPAQPVLWFALAISWVWVACVYGDCLQCSI